jgi:excisionase family DNA binding protein
MDQKVTVSELNEIVTVDEAARFLRVGRSLVYEAVNQKRIPSIRIGRRILIARAFLQGLVQEAERGFDLNEPQN